MYSALVTRLRLDCSSTALLPFDDQRHAQAAARAVEVGFKNPGF